MKQFFTLALAMGTAFLSFAQITGLSVETVVEHDGSVAGLEALDGYTTYRVYADVTSSTDFVSAVYGDASNPMTMGSDGDIFQAPGVNFNYANEVNPLFFENFPASEFDSWFTIGAENALDGVLVQNTPDGMAPALELFNAGQGFVINDPIGGSWFNVFPCAAGQDVADCAEGSLAFGGEDNKVLVAQITANGDIFGVLNLQTFIAGIQSNFLQVGLTFQSNEADVFGCTNEAASNYDATATLDDLSCIFPCVVELDLVDVSSPTCNGENDASIEVVATGAQGADWYFETLESANAYLDSLAQDPQANAPQFDGSNFGEFGGLIAEVYTIAVVDGSGCLATLEVNVPETAAVELVLELTTPVSCDGDSDAVLTVTSTTGGSGGYEYSLSTDPLLATTDTVWVGLPGNLSYSAFVTDSNGCIGQSETVTVQNPQAVVVDLLPPTGTVDASCANIADGEIFLVAYGGNAPQTIQYSVDGENFGPSPLMVPGGTYSVTAMDVFGCSGMMENEVVIGPEGIDVNAASVAESCFGANDGMVSWAPVGGQGAYSFDFDGSATTASAAMDLMPGEYEVAVTDEEMCTETVLIMVDAALEITTSSSTIAPLCAGENDGEVTVTAEGGTGAFQYSANGNNFSDNNVFDDLLAGDYTFFVQDENNCIAEATASVAEGASVNIQPTASTGSPEGQGTINLLVTGGVPPYTFEWIGIGFPFFSEDQNLTDLSSGSYTVEVTDSVGCSNTLTIDMVTDVQEVTAGVTASIFPNPSQGIFVLDIEGSLSAGSMPYQVLDAGGRMLFQGEWNVSSGAGAFRTTLDLTSAEAGMYRLVMIANGRPTSMQLVKMH